MVGRGGGDKVKGCVELLAQFKGTGGGGGERLSCMKDFKKGDNLRHLDTTYMVSPLRMY